MSLARITAALAAAAIVSLPAFAQSSAEPNQRAVNLHLRTCSLYFADMMPRFARALIEPDAESRLTADKSASLLETLRMTAKARILISRTLEALPPEDEALAARYLRSRTGPTGKSLAAQCPSVASDVERFTAQELDGGQRESLEIDTNKLVGYHMGAAVEAARLRAGGRPL